MNYRSIFFIHLAKTGGATIESMLRETYGDKNVCPFVYDNEFLEHGHAHLSYRVFAGHNPHFVSQVLPKPVFIFTFLRKPVDRVISAYNHLRRDTAHESHELLGASGDFVKDFVKNPHLPLARNAQTRFLGADADFAGAMRAVQRGDTDAAAIYKQIIAARHAKPMAEAFETACRRLDEMNFVGITERFDESIRILFSLLGRSYGGAIPVLNQAPDQNRMDLEDLTAEQLQATADANSYDTRLYEVAKRRFDHHARRSARRAHT